MPIAIEKLERVLSHFSEDKKYGLIYRGALIDLKADLHWQMAFEESSKGSVSDERRSTVFRRLLFLSRDVSNIETLIDRLAWQRDLWQKGDLDDGRWSHFSTVDIDLFHIELRSVFDYLAHILQTISDTPGSVPGKSFNGMIEWLEKPGNVEQFGNELAELVAKADWFQQIRDYRDNIIHRGADTMVFFVKWKIVFQTHMAAKRLINIPELMYNPNTVDFELYGAVLYGYMLDYLEDVAGVTYKRLGLERKADAWASGPDLIVLKTWLENAVRVLKGSS